MISWPVIDGCRRLSPGGWAWGGTAAPQEALVSTTLDRTTFQMSRMLEFFGENELQIQIGFPRGTWPIVLLKELIDNALDACETADMLPGIEVTLEPDVLSVRDNGAGMPVSTIERSLDYLTGGIRYRSRQNVAGLCHSR
jgi:DNA topoisomerase VI subunit B